MSVDRSSHAPILCKYAGTNLVKADANKHTPLQLDADVVSEKNEVPQVEKSGSTADVVIFGELLDVFPETKTCTVQYEGLLVVEAKAKAAAVGGTLVTADVAAQAAPGALTIATAAIVIGSYTENGKHYLIARR